MSVTTPAYCSRADAQRAIDFGDGQLTNQQIDRAIQSASRNIEGNLHRIFVPWDGTKWFDWPNMQRAYPWRLWLDRHDVLCLTSFSSGSVAIPLNTCFLRPANRKPGFPYRSIELDRSSTSTFGGNAATPQNSIQIAATWGFTADADQVAVTSANINGTVTTVTISNSALVSPGDLLILGYQRGTAPFPADTLGHAGLIEPYVGERLLVQDIATADTSTALSGSGCTTESSADTQLTVTGSGSLNVGEAIMIDAEEMLILSVNGAGVFTVQRSWNNTQLATHNSGAEVYAYRALTVERGAQGTSSQQASWTSGTTVFKHRVPSLIRDLAIAEAINRPLQETSGYARTVGSPDVAMPAPGQGLADLWDEAMTEYGRKARTRAI